MPQFLTIPQIAENLIVDVEKIRGWIRSGELRAVDIVQKKGARPKWRVREDHLEEFLATRANTPPPKPTRRRKSRAAVKEFIT